MSIPRNLSKLADNVDSNGMLTSSLNVAGGAANNVLYQSAASTTSFIANGTAGQALTSNGSSAAPSWQDIPVGAQGFVLYNIGVM
jgi:hypothetical protein